MNPLCRGKFGQVGQCIRESWTKSKKFQSKYWGGTRVPRLQEPGVEILLTRFGGLDPYKSFLCTHFCGGTCQQLQGQENIPASFKGSSRLIDALIMQHAASFKLYLNKCTAVMGKKTPKPNRTGSDNTSNLTADMTFGGSGKFMDSIIQKNEKSSLALST